MMIDLNYPSGDGVQTLVATAGHDASFAGPTSKVFTTARQAEAWLYDFIDEMRHYTDVIEVHYFGYDPNVYYDDGSICGTDGYPDQIGTYDDDELTIVWEST